MQSVLIIECFICKVSYYAVIYMQNGWTQGARSATAKAKQRALVKTLQHTAHRLVGEGRHCLQPCVCAMLRELDASQWNRAIPPASYLDYA